MSGLLARLWARMSNWVSWSGGELMGGDRGIFGHGSLVYRRVGKSVVTQRIRQTIVVESLTRRKAEEGRT